MDRSRHPRERQASDSAPEYDRRRAAIATIPLVAIGAFNAGLVVLWGANYLWGFVVFLPTCFVAALAWVAFRERR